MSQNEENGQKGPNAGIRTKKIVHTRQNHPIKTLKNCQDKLEIIKFK
jgi:hypothetical protein